MDAIGWDHEAAFRHFDADDFRSQTLALGHKLHFGGNLSSAASSNCVIGLRNPLKEAGQQSFLDDIVTPWETSD